MIEVPLTRGKVALIDDEDARRVLAHKWRHLWGKSGHEYAITNIRAGGRERVVYMHRFILEASPGVTVDHINNNGLDNQKSNLRFASPAQNSRNRRAHEGRKYKGVFQEKPGWKWRARIFVGGQRFHLGSFDTPEEAARAYDAAARARFGDFAKLNFPA
jgi:hypothetical protein